MIKRVFATILICLLLALPASAANWYVDNDATGNNDGTSWTDAWWGFAEISWASISAGDTIYISGGSTSKTYYEQLSIGASGTSGSQITITRGTDAGHNGSVKIDGGGTRDYCVYFGSADYVTVSYLEMDNSDNHACRIGTGATGAIVEYCTVRATGFNGIYAYQSDNITIRYNTVTTPSNVNSQTDCIGVYQSSAPVIEFNHLTQSNVYESQHLDVIQINRCTNAIVRYNYCNNEKPGYSNAQGIVATEMYTATYIYGNLVEQYQGNNAISFRNLTEGNADAYIYNNTLKGPGNALLYMTDTADPKIKNNVFWFTGDTYNPIKIADWSGTASNIDYNILYSPDQTYVAYFNGSSYNYAGWTGTLGFDTHGYSTDPLLDSNLKINSASSPCIDHGADLGSTYQNAFDPSDTTWPYSTVSQVSYGTAWEIGAFVYGALAEPNERIAYNVMVVNAAAWGGTATECLSYEQQSTGTTTGAVSSISNADNSYYWGQLYKAPANIDVCQVTVRLLAYTGDISGKTFHVYIYSVNASNTLETLLGTSNPVTGSNSWSGTEVDFTFSNSVSLTSGTLYAIVISMDEIDGSNYARGYCALSNETPFDHADEDLGRWRASKANYAIYDWDSRMHIYTDQ